jgi:small subunit ribosomal protein S21
MEDARPWSLKAAAARLPDRASRTVATHSDHTWFRPHLEDQALQVLVRDNNVDQAMRVLKKKLQREGVFREMKRRRFYEKPSEKTTREKAEAIRRSRKLARKQAIREGLIAAPKKKPLLPRRPPGAPFGAPTPRF